jgi:MFS family permease
MIGNDAGRGRATLGLLCAVNFMVILDAQIVILALPSLQAALGFSADGAQWVLSAYLLAFGGLLLLGGRAGDLLGRRRVLLAGTALFGVASLACGLAWTPGVLVGARVAHGLSAALMAPNALAILMTTFAEGPPRNGALALWGAMGGIGATAALLVGGGLTSALGWESIFFLNVPVAVLLLALVPRLLRESRDRAAPGSLDPAGAMALTGALVLLIYAVVQAPGRGWASAQTLALLGAAAVLAAVLVVVEGRAAAPLFPPRLLRLRSLTGGTLVMLLAGTAAWGMSVGTSLYAQDVLGLTPFEFGLGTVAMAAGTVAGSRAAMVLAPRVGLVAVAVVSMGLLATGGLLLCGVSAGGSYRGDLLPGFVVFGPGLGAGTVAATIAGLSGVREEEAGVASGTTTAAFQIGGALGSAIVTSVVVANTGTGAPAVALTEGLQAGFVAVVALAAAGLVVALVVLRPARPAPA